MGKLLDQFSNEMRNNNKLEKPVSAKELEAEKKDPFVRYRQALEKKENFEVVFDSSNKGTLVAVDRNGIKIVLDGEVLKKDLPYYEESNKASFIGKDFVVKVTSIDEDAGIVYVRSGYSNSKTTRSRVIKEIMAELNSDKGQLVLPGRVVSVSEKRALVDILGKGIVGIISVDNWQNGYVRHLPKVVEKGDVYDFVVMKPLGQKKNRSLAFRLTRVPITDDPWDKLKKDGIHFEVDDYINVVCISKPAGKSYWWGISDLVDGIEIMGDYTTKVPRPYVGVKYKCKVSKFDPDKKKFQVAPFEVIDTPRASKEAVKFISSGAIKEVTNRRSKVSSEKPAEKNAEKEEKAPKSTKSTTTPKRTKKADTNEAK